ncbi:MAG: hypothetical protein WD768_15260 [Phycisphaeraceae bacterium]
MREKDIQTLLQRRPFEPIRFVLSNGEKHEVRHPEMAMLSKSWIVLGTESKDDPGIAESTFFCSLLHIVKIEPIGKSKGAGNGRRSSQA